MRSYKLTTAVTAAAALLALAPAGVAAAHKNHGNTVPQGLFTGSCKVTLKVAPRLITSGESVLASGEGICSGKAAAAQTVTLYERPAGSPGFSVAGTATTTDQGLYKLPPVTLTNNTAFYATIGSTRSRERDVKVAAAVSLSGPPESKSLVLPTGRRNAVTFSGSVSPSDGGATAVLQRENTLRGTEWRRIGQPVLVDGEGHFSITHVFRAPGQSSIRVVVRSNHRNIASASNVLSYAISQAENPLLTIESTQDPLPFGGSTAVSGVVSGEANTVVTLLGRAVHGHYAPIATTTTDANGNYTFPTQTPPVSTFYRVTAGGRSSTVLYQGVKYVLTAAPSASSVSSGQPLTFTGTVSPAKAGHTIYLERENALGTNFHVVAIGSVAADGSYSLTRTFFAPGSYVLRVKIPGDSENGGTASTTFPTTVTPIASAKVPAEAPNNGALPPQGQV
jgi:hypothetical protein